MIRGVNFCKTDDLKGAASLLDTFLACYQKATKIHDLRCQLHIQGHPLYEAVEKSLVNEKGVFSFPILEAFFKEEEEALENWRKEKKRWLEDAPHLKLLSNSQLLCFLRRLLDLGKVTAKDRETNTRSLEWERVLGFLVYIFPGCSEENLRKFAAEYVKSRNYFGRSEQDRLKTSLEDAGGLVRDIKQRDKSAAAVQQWTTGKCRLYDASLLDAIQLEGLLFSTIFQKTPPKPFQFLQAREDCPTSLDDLNSFLERCSAHRAYSYAILGVNHLPSACKERLATVILEESLPFLALVFTGTAGLEIFTFLQRENCSVTEESQIKGDLNSKERMPDMRNFEVFLAVLGKSGDGKTTMIKKQMAQHTSPATRGQGQIVCSVNEDFKSSFLIKKIQTLTDVYNKVSIHFNISMFAPLNRVHDILRSWLYSGFLLDEETGDIVRMKAKGDSSLKDKKDFIWHLYFEIPEKKDKLLSKPVLDYLPLLK